MASTRNHMDPLNLRLNLKLRLSHLLPWTSHSEKSMGNLNPVHCWAHPFPILPPFTVLCFFLLDVPPPPTLSLYLSFCSLALCSRRLQHHLPGLQKYSSLVLLVLFETGAHEAQAALHLDNVKDDIELLIILFPFAKLWDYSCVLMSGFCAGLRIKPRTPYTLGKHLTTGQISQCLLLFLRNCKKDASD